MKVIIFSILALAFLTGCETCHKTVTENGVEICKTDTFYSCTGDWKPGACPAP